MNNFVELCQKIADVCMKNVELCKKNADVCMKTTQLCKNQKHKNKREPPKTEKKPKEQKS